MQSGTQLLWFLSCVIYSSAGRPHSARVENLQAKVKKWLSQDDEWLPSEVLTWILSDKTGLTKETW